MTTCPTDVNEICAICSLIIFLKLSNPKYTLLILNLSLLILSCAQVRSNDLWSVWYCPAQTG